LLITEPAEAQRLSKDSLGSPASPTAAFPFSTTGKVGQIVISKIKIGGLKIGGVTKKSNDRFGSASGDVPYVQRSNEGFRESPMPQPRSPDSPSTPMGPPGIPSEIARQAESNQPVSREPERLSGSGVPRDHGSSNEGKPVELGLSTPTHGISAEDPPPPSTSTQMQSPPQQTQSPGFHRPIEHTEELLQPPSSPSAATPKREGRQGGRHAFSASISGGKVSKLLGYTATDQKAKHHSDSSEYPSSAQQHSPRQKSKFSKFMTELSLSPSTTSKPSSPFQTQSGTGSPPPPPDKSQFRTPSEGSGRIKGFFADLTSRDLVGNKPSDKQASHRGPGVSPRTGEERPGGGGFGRFLADIGRRDLTGQTDEDRMTAARRRQQENTHVPAQPVAYDESASDWEEKLAKMEDVLPHIRRELLITSLKKAGGDEQRAIGLAVINSR
jgi:hypothetical protein